MDTHTKKKKKSRMLKNLRKQHIDQVGEQEWILQKQKTNK